MYFYIRTRVRRSRSDNISFLVPHLYGGTTNAASGHSSPSSALPAPTPARSPLAAGRWPPFRIAASRR